MKISAGTRRQLALLGVLGGILVLALVRSGRNEPATPRPAAAPASTSGASDPEESAARGRGRAESKKVSADDVPLISRSDLDAAPPKTGSGSRNIFDFPAPTPLPTPTPAPPPPPVCGDPLFRGPCPPPPPPPTPAPPEIPFKFVGTFGPKDQPIAVLVAGDKIVNARVGDTVFERFIIKKVGYESIDVGFVGPWTDVRRLPMAP